MRQHVYVISDLHLGGVRATADRPGFQICPPPNTQQTLPNLLDRLPRSTDDEDRQLVIAGDIVDFHAEGPFKAFTIDPDAALRKFHSVVEHTAKRAIWLGRRPPLLWSYAKHMGPQSNASDPVKVFREPKWRRPRTPCPRLQLLRTAMSESFTRRHRLDRRQSAPRHQDIPWSFRSDFVKSTYERLRESDASIAREYALYRNFCLAINIPDEQFYGDDDVNEHYSSDLLLGVVRQAEWHEALSIVEEAVKLRAIDRKEVNKLFCYHNIGYEVVRGEGDGPRVEVKYDAVVSELADASVATAPYSEIAAMIAESRKALADPKNINIANSISNSVKALEAFLKEWLSKRQGGARPLPTLGAVAKELLSKKLAPDNIDLARGKRIPC